MLYTEILTVYSQIHTKHLKTLCEQNVKFLGASVSLTAWNNSGSHWTEFHEIWYLRIFRTFVDKTQLWL